MDAPAVAPSFTPAHHASWHAPVSYVFAGLAGLLGLIFIAIFILSCAYLRLIDHQENRRERERSDLEAASSGGLKLAPSVLEEKYLVIMAGEEKPTFIATPISGRTSSEKNGISEEERCKKKHECCTCRA